MSKGKKRTKDKNSSRILVDPIKWGKNGNTYSLPPLYYYDIEFTCCDCGKIEVWTAKNQQYWYEELGKNVNSRAIRCQVCRAHINAIKENQQRHMQDKANEQPHPNESFFKKK